MPKYSTVQAYSDNSSNVQTVSYEQASGAAAAKAGPGEFDFCMHVPRFRPHPTNLYAKSSRGD